MWRTLQRSVVIVAGSVVLALVGNAVSPRGIPLITPPKPVLQATDVVPLDEAKQLWETGAGLFLDARTPADYAAGHIANALSLPAEQFDETYPRIAPLLTPDMPVIVYCNGVQCDLSHEVRDKLRALGYKNVRILVNGWTVWRQAGGITATGTVR